MWQREREREREREKERERERERFHNGVPRASKWYVGRELSKVIMNSVSVDKFSMDSVSVVE